MTSILSLVVVVLDIWGIIMTAQSRAQTGQKVLWVVLIILFPIVGLLLWYLMGPGKKK